MRLSPRELELRQRREADFERRQITPVRPKPVDAEAPSTPASVSRNAPVSRKGRRPIGDRAMTPAERQRRAREAQRAKQQAE